jgi:hypothetical protein
MLLSSVWGAAVLLLLLLLLLLPGGASCALCLQAQVASVQQAQPNPLSLP